MELENFTIEKVREGLKKKEFSAIDLTKSYLEKIEKEDKKIGAFLTISENLAIKQAKEIDEMILSGKKLPILAGVPCAIKDIILVEGVKCTAGSKILETYVAPYDARVVR
jgi:aspartyl-tRNA(Asn)/glutamyl-tRNA(Gln) amidotransferase subunit A